ncbi:mitochondrial arginine transporter BAC2 [Tanacetum coccineum]|uniref:Mitochondrial arginine transporter BAC2 n=1 Tax=Tanacetum coccineum TaxID=301880 RepID=A0ABQ5D143_9ASTR
MILLLRNITVPPSTGNFNIPCVVDGLYNGLGWLALGRIFGVGARFGTYELLTAFYKDGRQDNYVYVSEALMPGIAAGALNLTGSLKEYPWMITGTGRAPPVYHVRKPIDVISLEGWGALWRGLRPGLVRDTIFGGVFFSSWQFLHRAKLSGWTQYQEYPWMITGTGRAPPVYHVRKPIDVGCVCSDEDIGPLHPLAVCLAAGFSGSIAAAASHSFDNAKCRSQCLVLPKAVQRNRSASPVYYV